MGDAWMCPKCDPSIPPINPQESVWTSGKQRCDWCVDRLSLEHQQSAAYGEEHSGEGGAVLVRLSLQGLLVGLLRGWRALGRRHGGGPEGGAAGTHVVKVPRKLRLPGLLPQRFPNGCCFTGAALESRAGTNVERIPGP